MIDLEFYEVEQAMLDDDDMAALLSCLSDDEFEQAQDCADAWVE